jgi:hypothetical protein
MADNCRRPWPRPARVGASAAKVNGATARTPFDVMVLHPVILVCFQNQHCLSERNSGTRPRNKDTPNSSAQSDSRQIRYLRDSSACVSKQFHSKREVTNRLSALDWHSTSRRSVRFLNNVVCRQTQSPDATRLLANSRQTRARPPGHRQSSRACQSGIPPTQRKGPLAVSHFVGSDSDVERRFDLKTDRRRLRKRAPQRPVDSPSPAPQRLLLTEGTCAPSLCGHRLS